jgi:hypothetical protein
VINVLYQRNLADQFGAIRNSLPPILPITLPLFGISSDLFGAIPESVFNELKLPSMESLIRNSGSVMVVCDSNVGQRFFAMRSRWMGNAIAARG